MKFGCSLGIFLNSANLVCQSTDISKCFRGSLRLRDNESQLYINHISDGGMKLTTSVTGNFFRLFSFQALISGLISTIAICLFCLY